MVSNIEHKQYVLPNVFIHIDNNKKNLEHIDVQDILKEVILK